ncbi:MAG: glycine cleavage system protein GcvH [Planctomycetota bacterium]|jgi:glycine cleavage system H protein
MSVPEGVRVLESHEWAKKDGDVFLIGITAHAVEQLGDLTFIDLPAEGDEVSKGEQWGEIESVKAVSELNAPVGGKVVAVNEGLADDLAPVASDPFGAGWMIKIEPKHAAEGH